MSDTLFDIMGGVEAGTTRHVSDHQPAVNETDACSCGFSPWSLEHVVAACIHSPGGAVETMVKAVRESERRGYVRGRAHRLAYPD